MSEYIDELIRVTQREGKFFVYDSSLIVNPISLDFGVEVSRLEEILEKRDSSDGLKKLKPNCFEANPIIPNWDQGVIGYQVKFYQLPENQYETALETQNINRSFEIDG